MKIRIFLLTFFLLLGSRLVAQEDYRVTWNYSNQDFRQFVESAEKNLNVRFFFREEWVRDLKLENYPGANTLQDILGILFREKSIFYYIDSSRNVILTKSFAVKLPASRESNNKTSSNFIAPTEYNDLQQENNKQESTFVTLGNPADRNKPGKVTVNGYVTSKDTKEPIAGVTVFIKELGSGAVSNSYGFYTVDLPRGFHQLQFTFIGLRSRNVSLNLNGPGELNVEMTSVMIPLKETIISADRSVTLQRFETGVEKINITTFKLLPTSLGEADILKSILLIPGVQSVGEGSAGFNVRGGSADQNLILLYGAPLYNPSHYFGFFSAVNPDIIKDATLYKGGIPGRYGGRLSSVLDIVSKDGSRNSFDGNAGISPVTTHLMVEGPLKKDTCYYILSGRTTYSNWLFKLIDNPKINKSRASFYDLNGRVVYELDPKNKVELSSYFSNDSFRLLSDTTYSYTNSIVSLGWHHFFSRTFIANFSVNNSFYKYQVSSMMPPTEGYRLSHSVNSTAFRADFNQFLARHELNYGTEITRYDVLPGSYLPRGDSSLVIPEIIDRERALEAAVYIDDKFSFTENISINAGLRFSSYYVLGPRNVLVYDPEFPRSSFSVTDTLRYSSRLPYKVYGGPEIRLSANFRMTDKTSLKVNYNRTKQYLHLLSNTTSISPTDTWKLADSYLKPATGDQFAAGFYRMFLNSSLEVSVESYYKIMQNMVDFKGGADLILNPDIERELVNVKGKSYGLELMVKRTQGKIRGNVSYTYSRTLLRSTGKFSDEVINGGKWFPAGYDRPHDLVVALNYLISRRFSLSGNYTWTTGRPVTYPVAAYYYDNILTVHYSDRNKYRLPDYSRLDFSFKVSGNLRSKKIANPFWTFSVYNLLGRENVYSVYFMNQDNKITGYKLSVFGRAIPTVTFSFDF